MDLISAENNFLSKKASDGCPKAMLDYYYLYKQDTKHELALDATGHLERLFNEYTPFECLSLIAKNENEYEDLVWLKSTYLYLMGHLGALYIDYDGYERGILWVRKTMDMFELLFKNEVSEIIEEQKYQTFAFELFEEYKEYFCENEYANFQLDWEKDSLRNRFLANDNISTI